MLETLKKWGIDLTLKVKDLFTSLESQVYVKDLRKVMIYEDGRKCQYPKNYDQIVESGKIIEGKDSNDETIYKLLYGPKKKNGKQPSFRLTLVKEAGDRSYLAVDYKDNQGKQIPINELSESCFEPLGFSRMGLKKHVPIFEAEKTKDSKYPFELTNSSVLTKKGYSINDKTGEVDKKGRNGKLLYTSDYKKLSISFSEIRDQNGNLELDKSLISVPIVLAAGLAKICAKLLTFIPMKLGENLIARQNPVAKSFGYLLFIPAAAARNSVNMVATILKVPILLFVANEKKYGDAYFTMWKQQLKGCWEEAKSDFNVIKGEERIKPEQKDHKPLSIVGTWDELNARRPDIEKDLKKQGNDKGVSKSNEILKSPEEEQNKGNEILSDKSKDHVEKLQNERNLQKGQGATHTHSP